MLSVGILCSCEPDHPKDYLSVSGKLENVKDSVLYITGFGIRKMIRIQEDGSFKDSLKVAKPNLYSVSTPNSNRGVIYLKNGYNLDLTGDANKFFTSFTYKGKSEGAESNNFIINRYNFGQTAGNIQGFMLLEKQPFLDKIAHFKKGMDSITKLYKNADPDFIKKSDEQNTAFFGNLEKNYDRMHDAMVLQKEAMAKLEKGKVAPAFTDFEDYKGGKKSLSDFKGNYVYIDVWATWCRPCIAQIPHLKKLEEEFKGKNISFVSISTDNDRRSGGSWDKAHEKWKKMVKSKSLGGVQLWAGKQEVQLAEDYMITGIPRFILIDPEGKIVNHNEMRPSDPRISEYLTSIGVQ